MKMNKKKLLSLSLVIVLIAILSFGSLAWFNAQDQITNTFYVADSDGDGEPNFSINVYEQEAEENGQPVTDANGNPVYTEEGNTYTKILPGSKLYKNATVRNTGDYDQWVRIHFTFSDSAVWQKAIDKAAASEGVDFDTYVRDYLLTKLIDWECEETYVRSFNVFGEDTMTYTFYYSQPVEPNKGLYVLEAVNIPGVLVQEDMNFGTDGFTLTIKAEAVQVDNMPAPASAAFAAAGWGNRG